MSDDPLLKDANRAAHKNMRALKMLLKVEPDLGRDYPIIKYMVREYEEIERRARKRSPA